MAEGRWRHHIRKLVDIDRGDAGKGYQADCTENDVFLSERPILSVDVRFVLHVKCRIHSLPEDRLGKRSAALMQG